MSISQYLVADVSNTYQDGSANATANSEGWVCINGSTVRLMNQRTPASASSDALAGEICTDGNYIYVATGTNTWKRSALSTW